MVYTACIIVQCTYIKRLYILAFEDQKCQILWDRIKHSLYVFHYQKFISKGFADTYKQKKPNLLVCLWNNLLRLFLWEWARACNIFRHFIWIDIKRLLIYWEYNPTCFLHKVKKTILGYVQFCCESKYFVPNILKYLFLRKNNVLKSLKRYLKQKMAVAFKVVVIYINFFYFAYFIKIKSC